MGGLADGKVGDTADQNGCATGPIASANNLLGSAGVSSEDATLFGPGAALEPAWAWVRRELSGARSPEGRVI